MFKSQLQVSQENCLKLLQSIFSTQEVQITSFSRVENGVLNPIYSISANIASKQHDLILKLSNPIWKVYKTINEATVLQFIEKNTKIPVPHVYHFDAATQNEIGFEYILMSRVDGVPLSDIWESLSLEERTPWLEQVADILGENCDSKLGPFSSLSEYYCSLVDFRIPQLLQHPKFSHYAAPFEKLKQKLFMDEARMKEAEQGSEFCLCHLDLAPKNMLVNPTTKKIVGVIDWEWASYTFSDCDVSEVENNFGSDNKHGNKEFDLVCELFQKKKGQVAASYQIPPLSFRTRRELEKVGSLAMCLVSYEYWFEGKPAQEAEACREEIEQDVKKMFASHDIHY